MDSPHPHPHPTPPMDPNVNPYPTTFVQAETSTFKHVVQLLTGSPNTVSAANSKPSPSPASPQQQPQQQHLYQRRAHTRNLRILRPVNVNPAPNSPVLSPSMLDFPSLVLSPVTPLLPDPFNKPPLGSRPPPLPKRRPLPRRASTSTPHPAAPIPHGCCPCSPVTSPTAGSSTPKLL